MTAPASQSILDQLNTAVVVMDAELRLQYLNAAAQMLFSVSDRAYQTPFVHLYHEANDETVLILQQALHDGRPYTKREAQWHILGHTLTVDYTITPTTDYILMEIHSLTRLLAMAQESEMLTQLFVTHNLIRGLAHEIKNPLGGVRGAAQLLDRELKTPELKEYTQVIIHEADRLRNLVDRLMGPRQNVTIESINIHVIVERVLQLIKQEHSELRLIRDYDPSLPDLLGSTEQLTQVFLNIMQNAAQILNGTENPTLSIKTRIERQLMIGTTRYRLVCRIDVTDNGPGVDEAIMDTLFYPLVSARPNGTGLGLSIAQTIIKQHHGIIQCDSQPGRTTFSIFIPIEVSHDKHQ